jgi:hypothetical protein
MERVTELVSRTIRLKSRIPRIAVDHLGVPPAWLGYRHWGRETVPEYVERTGRHGSLEIVHPPRIHPASLPGNVDSAEALPGDRGWWGFSFRDVPKRANDSTFIATLPDCLLAHYRLPPDHLYAGDYYVGILNDSRRSVELREIRFREPHADVLRNGARVERIPKATWVIERVFHNYSHWLGAHLPKFLLLRERGGLDDVLLPPDLPPAQRASLVRLGFDVEAFRTYDPAAVQQVDELTVLGTDRFRPELVSSVRDAIWEGHSPAPRRRVFISRARAQRRRLLNEDRIWQILEPLGFERVLMEDLSLDAQVDLMMDTRVLVGSHGAGLTNMIFCAPGTQVLEIADLSFPNPNFYAMASGLGHEYWLAEGDPVGEGHPLFLDMVGREDEIRQTLRLLLDRA